MRGSLYPVNSRNSTSSTAQSATDLQSVIQKEAIYCAIGRCAPRLRDAIQFTDWIRHYLAAEARDTNPKYDLFVYCTDTTNSRLAFLLSSVALLG